VIIPSAERISNPYMGRGGFYSARIGAPIVKEREIKFKIPAEVPAKSTGNTSVVP